MQKKLLPPKENKGIYDLDKIRAQYESGFTIRQLAIYWEISYTSLYRELKGRKNKSNNNGQKT